MRGSLGFYSWGCSSGSQPLYSSGFKKRIRAAVGWSTSWAVLGSQTCCCTYTHAHIEVWQFREDWKNLCRFRGNVIFLDVGYLDPNHDHKSGEGNIQRWPSPVAKPLPIVPPCPCLQPSMVKAPAADLSPSGRVGMEQRCGEPQQL